MSASRVANTCVLEHRPTQVLPCGPWQFFLVVGGFMVFVMEVVGLPGEQCSAFGSLKKQRQVCCLLFYFVLSLSLDCVSL